MLDRQHLALIREVSRSGSVTAAAERLHLSQSAISHAVAKLEKRFQVRVWRKKGRNLELTQAGTYLLDLAERLVPEFDHAERILADISCGRRGALRIGMECHPCEKWLMRVTAPYLAEWPDVDLEVRSAFRFDGLAALQSHEIDVLVTPDPVAAPDLHFTPVFGYELRLAVHEDHPLAGRSFVEASDLVDEDLLTVPVPIERLDIYTRFLIPAACRPKRRVPVESLDLMLQLVVGGRGGWGLAARRLQEMAAGMPITALRIATDGLHKSINVGLRASDMETDYLSGFLGIAGRIRP
jgi:LysR family transcriptional regulator for metE and metH